jgi:hypothetical protein
MAGAGFAQRTILRTVPDGLTRISNREDAFFLLRDQAFLPHISTRKINGDVLALLERAIARQHGSRQEEPSAPAVEEHPECRDDLNSPPDGHKVEIITRHDVPSLLASRFPPKNREGVR